MKNIRNSDFARFIGFTAAWLVALSTLIAPPVQAQSLETSILNALKATPVFFVGTDDQDTAMLIRYIGTTGSTSNSGTVEVTVTSSDMTFLQGAQGSEAASTEFECPVSGALGGIIDVSNAACNTLGEIADVINASTSWRAVILDGLRTDVADGRLLTMAATRATTTAGLAIKWDTSTAFDYTSALVPPEFRRMDAYIRGNTRDINFDLYENSQTIWLWGYALNTFGSGTSNLNVYSVDVRNSGSGNAHSETVSLVWSEVGGATTVAKTYDDQVIFGGVRSRPNEKMVIRLDNSAAMATVTYRQYGTFRYQ